MIQFLNLLHRKYTRVFTSRSTFSFKLDTFYFQFLLSRFAVGKVTKTTVSEISGTKRRNKKEDKKRHVGLISTLKIRS